VVSNPFSDTTPANSAVFSRGQVDFLKTTLKRGNNVLVPPDADWHSQPQAVKVTSPDGADVTSSWLTLDLDPDDPTDNYNATHGAYTGTFGLFHDGQGRLAAKIKVPSTAEVTVYSPDRKWTVTWKVKKDGFFVEYSETFDVGEAGVLVFNADIITVSEVKRGIVTKLTDADVKELITEASDHVRGILREWDIDPDRDVRTLTETLRESVTLYARSLVFDMDASAGRKISMVQEGSKKVGLAGNSSRDAENLRTRSNEALTLFVKRHSRLKRPRLRVTRQARDDGVFHE
jgi:hypothetical protein